MDHIPVTSLPATSSGSANNLGTYLLTRGPPAGRGPPGVGGGSGGYSGGALGGGCGEREWGG